MATFYLDADVFKQLAGLLVARGHDVLTTTQAGRLRAGDEEQLAYAASLGRVLVTHNGDDFELLQRAWRFWADLWSVQPRPIHSGILSVPQPITTENTWVAREIDAFVRSANPLENRFYEWEMQRGWVAKG